MRRFPFQIFGPYVRFLTRGHRRVFSVFTHLTYEERLFLYKTALKLKSGDAIVEIGSYLGGSSCFLAAAAMERGCKVYCVDTWQNDGMTEGPRDTYTAFLKNTERFRNIIVPVRMTSQQAASQLDISINMLFVDGDHGYEAVSSDLHIWLPKLSGDAWLVLHDSGWAGGVQRAIQEIIEAIETKDRVLLPNLYAAHILSDRPRRSREE